MTLRDALASAIQRLEDSRVGSPRMNAELLIMFVLGCDRAFLYAHPERKLTADDAERFEKAAVERARGVPSQYITGHQEFWGMDFIVTPAVLIPRPETEHLIETVLPLARAMKNPTIVDVGTGSGCIAVALAKELPQAQISATDISPAALEIARANATRHTMQDRIGFQEADLLDGVPPESVDFVVSNPPYVGESEEEQVQLEVRKFEPINAVFAGPTGLEIIERLVPQASSVLRPGGWLVMEISGSIADGAPRLLSAWQEFRITKDLQGISRIVSARKK